jgi:hypothetical protein
MTVVRLGSIWHDCFAARLTLEVALGLLHVQRQ